MKSFSLVISLFSFLLVTCNVSAETEIFKCYDKDGRPQYSARPSCNNPEKMNLKSQRFHTVKPTESQQAEIDKQQAERRKMCDDANKTLTQYRTAPFLYKTDEKTQEKVRLTPEETEDAILQAEKDVAYWCKDVPVEEAVEEETVEEVEEQAEETATE